MRVEMLTTAAGPNGVLLAGKIYEVEAHLGREWCERGYARRPGATPRSEPSEVATAEPEGEEAVAVERAIHRRKKKVLRG